MPRSAPRWTNVAQTLCSRPTYARFVRVSRVVAVNIVLLLAAVGLSACGGLERVAETTPVTVTVTKTVPREAERDRQLHDRRRAARAAPSRYVACDANITVRRDTTTCGFAQNVFYEYWLSGRSDVIDVYSPAARATFETECRQSVGRVICTTADRGRVRFPVTEVDDYTEDQAAEYAAGADLGPSAQARASAPADEPLESESDSQPCDENYEGACLDPNSYDYDCENGNGDGPDYTGEVYVVGDDHFDLDRDGDGVACNW